MFNSKSKSDSNSAAGTLHRKPKTSSKKKRTVKRNNKVLKISSDNVISSVGSKKKSDSPSNIDKIVAVRSTIVRQSRPKVVSKYI